jgi:Pyruvate/2-oxoacid:ferredoxin oxidoreductase delta subunit
MHKMKSITNEKCHQCKTCFKYVLNVTLHTKSETVIFAWYSKTG